MRLFPIGAIVIAAALTFIPAEAQQTAGHEQHQHDQMMSQSGGMDHDKMMADMKAADAKLQSLVEQMKSAQGDAKITAMQNLLSELVQNEVQMHQHMAMMHDHMISQMQKK